MANKNTTRKVKQPLPKDMATFEGLHTWSTKLFEELGWIVLAKAKGMDYKVIVFKKSIQKLIDAIKKAYVDYTEKDRKRDLKIILHHA
jgi:hypothetical protein